MTGSVTTETLTVEVTSLPGDVVIYRVLNDSRLNRDEAVQHLRAAADDLESR